MSGSATRRWVLASALGATAIGTLFSCGASKQGAQHPHASAIFASACSGCHTLTGHDTKAPGGDLAIADLNVATIASFIRVMPVQLPAAEVVVVAAYVRRKAAANRRG